MDIYSPWWALLGTLWPGRCVHCRRDLTRGALCAPCAALISAPSPRPRPLAGGSLWALHPYEGPVQAVILGVKYRRQRGGLTLAGRWMRAGLPDALRRDPPALIVPMPSDPRRLKRRGCDLPLALAQQIAGPLNRPLARGALRRRRSAPPQASQPLAARRENVADLFAPGRDLGGRDVVLVDDVATTGATLAAATAALKAGGAGRVRWVTLAITPEITPR